MFLRSPCANFAHIIKKEGMKKRAIINGPTLNLRGVREPGVYGSQSMDDYFGELKIVDVNIRRLRIKIEDDSTNPTYITTIWGYGYKWGF